MDVNSNIFYNNITNSLPKCIYVLYMLIGMVLLLMYLQFIYLLYQGYTVVVHLYGLSISSRSEFLYLLAMCGSFIMVFERGMYISLELYENHKIIRCNVVWIPQCSYLYFFSYRF